MRRARLQQLNYFLENHKDIRKNIDRLSSFTKSSFTKVKDIHAEYEMEKVLYSSDSVILDSQSVTENNTVIDELLTLKLISSRLNNNIFIKVDIERYSIRVNDIITLPTSYFKKIGSKTKHFNVVYLLIQSLKDIIKKNNITDYILNTGIVDNRCYVIDIVGINKQLINVSINVELEEVYGFSVFDFLFSPSKNTNGVFIKLKQHLKTMRRHSDKTRLRIYDAFAFYRDNTLDTYSKKEMYYATQAILFIDNSQLGEMLEIYDECEERVKSLLKECISLGLGNQTQYKLLTLLATLSYADGTMSVQEYIKILLRQLANWFIFRDSYLGLHLADKEIVEMILLLNIINDEDNISTSNRENRFKTIYNIIVKKIEG